MKKIFAILVLCTVLMADLRAQGIVVDAKVVDAETRGALPNASVSIGADRHYIANADGEFSIEAEPQEVLTVSYVGYKPVRVRAENVGTAIKLSPYAVELGGVNVLPLKSIITRAHHRIRRISIKRTILGCP